jgi:hypothetical protein
LIGPRPQSDGHRKSTLRIRVCTVENANTLCISGYERAFPREISGQCLRKPSCVVSRASRAKAKVSHGFHGSTLINQNKKSVLIRVDPCFSCRSSSAAMGASAEEYCTFSLLCLRPLRKYSAESCRWCAFPGTRLPRTCIPACLWSYRRHSEPLSGHNCQCCFQATS